MKKTFLRLWKIAQRMFADEMLLGMNRTIYVLLTLMWIAFSVRGISTISHGQDHFSQVCMVMAIVVMLGLVYFRLQALPDYVTRSQQKYLDLLVQLGEKIEEAKQLGINVEFKPQQDKTNDH